MTPTPPTPLIIDNDGGLDDALAIVLLARSDYVELAGITSVHGNVTAAAAAANSNRLLELLGDHTTPVALGAAEPSAQPLHLAHPTDHLARLIGRPRRRRPTDGSAAELMVTLAKQHAGSLDLLATGPLTNIALALQAAPELPQLLRRVVIMGGCFDGGGNITPHAESNVYHDPEAAQDVFTAGFNLTVVPLEVTRTATATQPWLGALTKVAPGVRMTLGAGIAFLAANSKKLPTLRMHDALAAAVMLDPAIATERHESPVDVRLAEDAYRGQTTKTSVTGRRATTIVRSADTDSFRSLLLHALSTRS